MAQQVSAIERIGESDVTGVFAGVNYNAATDTGDLFVTRNDPAYEASVLGAVASSFAIHIVPNSRATLMALENRVSQDVDALYAQRGIQISLWGPHDLTNTLQLFVINPTPEDISYLTSTYGGPSLVSVVAVSAASNTSTRFSDNAPYAGGDFINVGTTFCTSGWGTHSSNGSDYLITAGHCFANGASVQNGSTGPTIGTVTNRSAYVTDGVDAEQIKTPSGSSAYFYYNDTSAVPAKNPVTTAGSGLGAYKSGSTTNEVGVNFTDGPDHCESDFGSGVAVNTCHVSPFTGTTGTGDSGGPVWGPAGTAQPVGITSTAFVLAGQSTSYCGNSHTNTQTCYPNGTATDMQTILNAYATSLKTG